MIAREFLNLETPASHFLAQSNIEPLQLIGTINMLARDLIGKSEIKKLHPSGLIRRAEKFRPHDVIQKR
ncbi:MAG: hypothetical protein ABW152_01565 [Candidatus Thiodiazotropha endolucinida]